ncbi:IS30 family transposase [Chryseobacterium mucoviscidosis]|uniref:IS30 family transposase n=1 Tax=unclassified Paenibacillus TaxID=185978 RepID=UPI0009A42701|nr:IS30 family transposase [Paenibacillus sp. 11B]MDN8588867.1 IS30 family transposase [Paenibacillus sp. 11B]OPG93921.1 IS30 family transposase [Chryseobacterium mucoviscidosis]
MSYTHLSIVERSKLEILHRQGQSSRAIAKELGRHPSTICRELDRATSSQPYHAEQAQSAYEERRQASISPGKWSEAIAISLEEKLQATWSPEQITERFRIQGLPSVSFKTIYRWLYAGRLVRGTLQVLRHKGKRQKPAETRGKFAIGRSISDRPKEVRSRETFGHWELDTVVSGRGKSKGCVATLIERKTRLYTAILMPDRTALSMEIALGVAISQYPTGTFLTATADRGKEFACYTNLEKSYDLHVYFADPYSSWQRGSNENANGLLREFFPKGTDLAKVEDEDLAGSLDLINHRPRKCLGWRTAHESFTEELSHLV